MRRIATIAALSVPALLAAGVAAPAALAADDCPNAAVRAQQGVQHLPNCLAYEKVTPDEKGGAYPRTELVISADGGNLLFSMNAALGDSTSFGALPRYVASRTPDGAWGARTTIPPLDGATMPKLSDPVEVVAATPDLSRRLLSTPYPIHPNDQGIANPRSFLWTSDAYLQDPDGSLTWLVPDPSVVDSSTLNVTPVGASRDLSRVVLQTGRLWDPRVTTTNVQRLYVWSRDGGTVLASVLPNGDPAPAVATTQRTMTGSIVERHEAVSADGRRVAFVSGTGEERRTYVRFDADNPSRAVTREASVGPNGERCLSDTSGVSTFRALSADGTKLLFRCGSSPLAGTLPIGLYLRDLDGGPQAVRQLVPGALANFLGGNDDFSRIYARNADAVVLVRDGVVEPTPLVATSSFPHSRRLAVSPDGEHFAIETVAQFGLPGVDPDPGAPGNPDDTEVYVYSARTGEAACASCRQDGTPTEGQGMLDARAGSAPGGGFDSVTPMGNDGSLVFSSSTALVPEDTNGVADAYAWVDGRPVLLSSGRGRSAAVAAGASGDGGSLFFVTPSSLVADDTDGGAYDIYVARRNGGRLLPDAPTECVTQCQPAGPGTPEAPRVGTGEALPDGNLVEQTTRPRATVGLTVGGSVRGTSTTVRVKASRAGTIRLSGDGLRRVTKTVKQAGTYRVTVRLTASAAKRQRSRGRLATRVTARFSPSSGAPVQTRKAITFVAKKGGR